MGGVGSIFPSDNLFLTRGLLLNSLDEVSVRLLSASPQNKESFLIKAK
jgi:hypothetical protein